MVAHLFTFKIKHVALIWEENLFPMSPKKFAPWLFIVIFDFVNVFDEKSRNISRISPALNWTLTKHGFAWLSSTLPKTNRPLTHSVEKCVDSPGLWSFFLYRTFVFELVAQPFLVSSFKTFAYMLQTCMKTTYIQWRTDKRSLTNLEWKITQFFSTIVSVRTQFHFLCAVKYILLLLLL